MESLINFFIPGLHRKEGDNGTEDPASRTELTKSSHLPYPCESKKKKKNNNSNTCLRKEQKRIIKFKTTILTIMHKE